MKVLFKLTIENLKRNKMMSLFYCIGIFLSVVMLTSMIIFYHSSNDFQKKERRYSSGEYELIYISDEDREGLKSILPEENVEEDIRITNLGYIPQEDGTYIRIRSFNQTPKKYLHHYQMGTYPTNEHEIMVENEFFRTQQLKLKDRITLDIIDSITGELKKNQEFTITGVYYQIHTNGDDGTYFEQIKDRAGKEHPISGEMMTLKEDDQEQPFVTGYLALQNMDADGIVKLKEDVFTHLLGTQFVYDVINDKYENHYESHSLVYFIIIVFFTVVLIHMISNISILSFKKKLHDFGMLKSIGATSWQLLICSLIEAGIYAIIMIPLALLCSVTMMHIVLGYISSFLQYNITPFAYEMVLGAKDVFTIVLFNTGIILLCNLVPVIKMRKYNVTDLIKGHVELQQYKYKKYAVLEKLFGIEAQIAKRNQRINKYAVRSVSFSIGFSIVLYLCGNYLFNIVTMEYEGATNPISRVIMGISLMLAVIAILNLCCVVFSNIILRKKEHQILVSIGLENRQLRRMLFFENGNVVIRGLLIGIPLAEFMNYLIYEFILEQKDFPFVMQWETILVMIVFVVLTTSILVFVAHYILRKEIILTSIKD